MGKHQGRKQMGFGTWHRAAVVAVAGLPIAASAADGTYLGLVGGANFLKDQNFTIIYPNNDGPLLGGTAIGKVNFDTGWAGGLVVGHAFSNGLRPELELMYRSDDLKRIRLATFGLNAVLQPDGVDATGVRGSQDAQTAMANLWFDLFKSSRIRPYIGAGVAYMHIFNARDGLLQNLRIEKGIIRFNGPLFLTRDTLHEGREVTAMQSPRIVDDGTDLSFQIAGAVALAAGDRERRQGHRDGALASTTRVPARSPQAPWKTPRPTWERSSPI